MFDNKGNKPKNEEQKQDQKHEQGNVFMPTYDKPTREELKDVNKIMAKVEKNEEERTKYPNCPPF